jgi:8-oxo-dGTP pyrophosphatase MutT (NUDIX family)
MGLVHNSPSQWHTITASEPEHWAVLTLRRELREHARDGRRGTFVIADAPNWVNILPITTKGDIILVEQFRHGTSTNTFEIPGGVVHGNESLVTAAERECLEETGWGSAQAARQLGVLDPTPAFQSNTCTVFVWEGCELVKEQQLDPNEDIVVHEVTINDFENMIADGRIRHSLVVAAFALFRLHHRKT